ncbi:MAG: hypothetical protein WA919_00800 [Coleofasciculaceae cyanobacterium]
MERKHLHEFDAIAPSNSSLEEAIVTLSVLEEGITRPRTITLAELFSRQNKVAVGGVQNLTENSTIAVLGNKIAQVSSSADLTLISNPAIAPGTVLGQELIVFNAGNHKITLPNNGITFWSNRPSHTISPKEVSVFYWLSNIWISLMSGTRL